LVALDYVRVLVLLHADAVAGAVDEELAVAGIRDDPPGRPVDVLARRADRRRRHAGPLGLVQHGIGLGDRRRRLPGEHAARRVAAVPGHRAPEVAQHDLTLGDDAFAGVVVRAGRVGAG